ncbi:hypothetical protein Hs30E_15750 [Lactococcus hodotermopsidis]|uniref:Uncharacterized protein n=1 Tax=Pseudolactococcus hodotermopsidis TaxID=2709157 RepID=A0A6A0BEZ8_9LACT|nr:hypothetical protein Hs30E_15750 [Lactococcus hodotermopsidis]
MIKKIRHALSTYVMRQFIAFIMLFIILILSSLAINYIALIESISPLSKMVDMTLTAITSFFVIMFVLAKMMK